jgi:hypothetical protein
VTPRTELRDRIAAKLCWRTDHRLPACEQCTKKADAVLAIIADGAEERVYDAWDAWENEEKAGRYSEWVNAVAINAVLGEP